MSLERIVALVPMRHISVRVPGKNYRPIAGKPLYHHILETLLSCPEISQVVVDTDSPVILEGLAKDFPGVTALLRPEHLRAAQHQPAAARADHLGGCPRAQGRLPGLRLAIWRDPTANPSVGRIGQGYQSQPGCASAHPGSAACV